MIKCYFMRPLMITHMHGYAAGLVFFEKDTCTIQGYNTDSKRNKPNNFFSILSQIQHENKEDTNWLNFFRKSVVRARINN